MTHVQTQTPKQFDKAWKQTSRQFSKTLDEHQIVGGALLFLEEGKEIGKEYYGFADLEQNRAVDERTIFHWASITKTFTAIAIMQLRDRRLLSLNDPVLEYLPELQKVYNPFGGMDEVTIRHVMSHSAGFRSPTWPWGGRKPWHPFEPTEWEQIVAMLPYTEIKFEPGSAYNYSNPAIIFLGKIIEQLTGDDYEVYVDKNILKPLGMHHSYFDVTPYHLQPYRSNSYTLRQGEPKANGLDFDTGITASNGGLNAPLEDMAKYLSFLTDAPGSPHILQRSSLEEMWEARQLIKEDDDLKSEMGLSFFIESLGEVQVVGHTGTQQSFYSFFYIHPASSTACIGVTNTNGPGETIDPGQVRNEVSRSVMQNLFLLYQQKN